MAAKDVQLVIVPTGWVVYQVKKDAMSLAPEGQSPPLAVLIALEKTGHAKKLSEIQTMAIDSLHEHEEHDDRLYPDTGEED